jgi:hypothetical protein
MKKIMSWSGEKIEINFLRHTNDPLCPPPKRSVLKD